MTAIFYVGSDPITHETVEEALLDIRSMQDVYPVVEASADHPLRINLFQADGDFAAMPDLERLPGTSIFVATEELRRRVLAALIGDCRDNSRRRRVWEIDDSPEAQAERCHT